MQRYTVTANLNGGLPQRPIFEGTEHSLPYTSFPPKSHLRDISFSSSTRPGGPKLPAEECFGPGIDDTEISIFDAQRYFNEGRDHKEKKQASTVTVNLDKITDRCDLSSVSRLSSVSSVDGYGRKHRTRSFHATPTASSEASWNSQSGLLSIPPGSIAVSMRDLPSDGKRRGSSTKWLTFATRCPCSGKKSVQVEEKFSNPKNPFYSNCSSNTSLNPKKQSSKSGEVALNRVTKEKSKELASNEKEKVMFDKNMIIIDERRELKVLPGNHSSSESGGCHRVISPGRSITEGGAAFSFPVLNPPAPAKLLQNRGKPTIQLEEHSPRESLEVFRPPIDEPVERRTTELQRRLLMSFSGETAEDFTFPASPCPKTRAIITDEDVASDTSSDLFEIESFSTQTTMHPLYRSSQRDSFDELLSSNDGKRILGNGKGMLQFRRSLDGTMTTSIAPTECYEPSEVSIDWSVTTAEGFDRGSVTNFSTTTTMTTTAAVSEYENVRFIIQKEFDKVANNGDGGGGDAVINIRRKGNGLLSCISEKAVSTVGPHPAVKQEPDHQRRHADAGTGAVPVESCQIPATSNSACMSRAFATQ
ncbi:protein PHYTOCHROME KINASE SUBSTRATE 4-like [Telopea speciosissima]|uniref:protein PHYTOCHROME KINASE SUBSTRATE 4-like n=1 Tax=Telopea speciosissima TaxID=54955 RepID=UPI001CC7212A|nr:protein PHYTOCHROME KINASE SUBSTRATE 4-like [Telopea speciosissima]